MKRLATLLVLAALPCAADMLYLRQGEEYKGDLVAIGEDGVKFRIAATGEEKLFARDQVQRLELERVKQTQKRLDDLDDIARAAFKARVDASRFPEADSVILSDFIDVVLSKDGEVIETERIIRQILTESGQDEGNVFLKYRAKDEKLTVTHARTIGPDETVIELSESAMRDSSINAKEPTYDNQHELKFALKGAVPGSLIDYEVHRQAKWNDPNVPWDLEESFRGAAPILSERVWVEASWAAGRLQFSTPHGADALALTAGANGDMAFNALPLLLTVEAGNQAAVLSEPQMPETEDLAPRLIVSNTMLGDRAQSNWEQVGYVYGESLTNALAACDGCAAKAAALTKEAKTDEAKAAAIYRFVAQDVRTVEVAPFENTYAPRKADEVLADGFGNALDKTALFLALLDKAGIPAKFVWVRSQGNGALAESVPTLAQMTAPLARLTLGKKTVWADVAAENLRLGTLPATLQGLKGLLVDGEKSGLVDVPLAPVPVEEEEAAGAQAIPLSPEQGESETNLIRAQLKADGTLEVERNSLIVGTGEADWRDMKKMSAEELKISMQKAVTTLHPAAELVDFEVQGMNDLSLPIHVRVRYRVPGFALKGGNDLLVFHLPEVTYSADEVGRAERKYPLHWNTIECSTNEVLVEVPEGFEVKYVPAEVACDSHGLHYAAKAKELPGSVAFRDEYLRTARELAPDRYDDYKRMAETRARLAREWVVLVRKE